MLRFKKELKNYLSFEQAIKIAEQEFKRAKIRTASLDALLILSYVTGKSKEFILAYPEKKISSKQLSTFFAFVKKRLNFYPLAYILNKKEFFSYDFYVDQRVFIPRPETEKIVELALNKIEKHRRKNWQILDLGTGSGCIGISLAKELEKRKIKYQILASDISSKALAVAKINAKRHKVKNIKFLQSDLLKKIFGKFDIILANLPYLKPQQIRKELRFEPELALKDQNQIKIMLKQVKKFLKNNGWFIYETEKNINCCFLKTLC